ncbi:MAG: DUF4390 domain-containing protein [Spirochaetia bacterium]
MLLVLLAALGAAPSWAQSLDLGVSVRPDGIHASLWFRWNKEQELVSSLQNGMEARIVFTLRVYQRRGGLFPFLGDKLLTETSVARSAFWDFLDRKFVVESDDGSRTAYTSAPDLLLGFLSLADFPVSRLAPREGDRQYVSARARLEPVRLMPPLTIVTLAGAAASYTTPWEKRNAQ